MSGKNTRGKGPGGRIARNLMLKGKKERRKEVQKNQPPENEFAFVEMEILYLGGQLILCSV
jgi:hypothetical protein